MKQSSIIKHKNNDFEESCGKSEDSATDPSTDPSNASEQTSIANTATMVATIPIATSQNNVGVPLCIALRRPRRAGTTVFTRAAVSNKTGSNRICFTREDIILSKEKGTITEEDILTGDIRVTRENPGNKFFQSLIDAAGVSYKVANNTAKKVIVNDIVESMGYRRFFEYDPSISDFKELKFDTKPAKECRATQANKREKRSASCKKLFDFIQKRLRDWKPNLKLNLSYIPELPTQVPEEPSPTNEVNKNHGPQATRVFPEALVQQLQLHSSSKSTIHPSPSPTPTLLSADTFFSQVPTDNRIVLPLICRRFATRPLPRLTKRPIWDAPSDSKKSTYLSASLLQFSEAPLSLDAMGLRLIEGTPEGTILQRRAVVVVPEHGEHRQMVPGCQPVNEFSSLGKEIRVNNVPFVNLGVIGKGGFADVYRVVTKDRDHALRAIKTIRLVHQSTLEPLEEDKIKVCMNEVAMLNHFNGDAAIIGLYDSQVDLQQNTIFIVMEHGECDLKQVLEKKRTMPVDLHFVRCIWSQMLDAVRAIHGKKIIHGDLKPCNFVFVNNQLKLADFGLARALPSDGTPYVFQGSCAGTPYYTSPEAIGCPSKGRDGKVLVKIGLASDIWSLGVILYEMYYRCFPFDAYGQDVGVLYNYITNPGYKVKYPLGGDLAANNVIDGCLQRTPEARPSIEQLLNQHEVLRRSWA